VHNQTGPFPQRWDKTSTVIDVRQFHQYLVRMAGSGRATLRNRKFLRKCVAPSPAAVRGHLPDAPMHQPEGTPLPDPVPRTVPLEIDVDSAPRDTPLMDTPHTDTSPSPLTPQTPLRTPHRALDTPGSPPTISTIPPSQQTPTQGRPASPAPVRIPALRRSTRPCVTNRRPNYKE
jgi:hypothetical protein